MARDTKGRLGKVILGLFILLGAAALGWVAVSYFSGSDQKIVRIPLIELQGPSGDVLPKSAPGNGGSLMTVRIFYPAQQGISSEVRRINGDPLQIRVAEALLTEYIRTLPGSMPDARVLGVYRDKNHTLYVDLSDEFRRAFSGDAMQEFNLLRSLYETVVQNLPGTDDVRILIEGKEIESIGGHFFSFYPLKDLVRAQ